MSDEREKERRLLILRASLPYLEGCSLEAFRVELLVQALDGVKLEDAPALIQRARREADDELVGL